MPKTPEEVYEYVLNYKNNLLHYKDNEKSRALNKANDADNRVVTQLILTSTVLLTVIGGLIASGKGIGNDGVKVLLTMTVVSLLLSICSGLIHFIFVNRFFSAWGKHLHSQGALISKDQSVDVDGLQKLMEKLEESSSRMPSHSLPFFSILQAFTFVTGLIFVLVVVLIKIYS